MPGYETETSYLIKKLENGILIDPMDNSNSFRIFSEYGYESNESAIEAIERRFEKLTCEFVILKVVKRVFVV